MHNRAAECNVLFEMLRTRYLTQALLKLILYAVVRQTRSASKQMLLHSEDTYSIIGQLLSCSLSVVFTCRFQCLRFRLASEAHFESTMLPATPTEDFGNSVILSRSFSEYLCVCVCDLLNNKALAQTKWHGLETQLAGSELRSIEKRFLVALSRIFVDKFWQTQ